MIEDLDSVVSRLARRLREWWEGGEK